MKAPTALVTGSSGFIGYHLANYLVDKGYFVRGVDIRHPEFQRSKAHDFMLADLRDLKSCRAAIQDIDEVFHLAADMGGIGYITQVHADVAVNNVLMDANMLRAAKEAGVKRFFYSSSACAYRVDLQSDPDFWRRGLKESDAWPANPEPAYGLEKLYAEELCVYHYEDYGLETRVARFHNIAGPVGTYTGGREKAPAALCRKVAEAKNGDTIVIWGDGQQTRSFCYVGDCVEGVYRLMQSRYRLPLNIGSDRLVTIDELAHMIIRISGKDLGVTHDTHAPQGVRGRNSDNSLIRDVLGWSPTTPMETWLRETYTWIEERVKHDAA